MNALWTASFYIFGSEPVHDFLELRFLLFICYVAGHLFSDGT